VSCRDPIALGFGWSRSRRSHRLSHVDRGLAPNPSSSWICHRHRQPPPPRKERSRSSHHATIAPAANPAPLERKASGLPTSQRGELTGHGLLYATRRPHRRRPSKAPPGRGRGRERLFPSAAAAFASPTTPRKTLTSCSPEKTRPSPKMASIPPPPLEKRRRDRTLTRWPPKTVAAPSPDSARRTKSSHGHGTGAVSTANLHRKASYPIRQ